MSSFYLNDMRTFLCWDRGQLMNDLAMPWSSTRSFNFAEKLFLNSVPVFSDNMKLLQLLRNPLAQIRASDLSRLRTKK
nr:hypothetical protein [Tanacetum cinerariifolium]